MGIFRSGDTPPDWCELRRFSIERPARGVELHHARREPRERLLVTQGRCALRWPGGAMVLRAGQFLDPEVSAWTVAGLTDDAELLRLSGRWGDEIAGCGIWSLRNEDGVSHAGDPVDYLKRTRLDPHYHDYDEYWLVLDGAATVVVSGRSAKVAAGDCVPIGMGHHHDMPEVEGVMRGAFFETTVEGRKRLGHLWNHTHGPAEPRPERVWRPQAGCVAAGAH